MPRKIKKGDTYLLRGVVTRISDDGLWVTLRLPVHEVPITIAVSVLERSDSVIDEQGLGK